MFYFVRIPRWVQKLYSRQIWEMSRTEPTLYLSFDDGPHPEHTLFVLDQLAKYEAKATFFCIGENVKLYPEIYRRLLDEGHSVGNHTMHHMNGKKATDKKYIQDIAEASEYINSDLFRPPYGMITPFRVKLLTEKLRPYRIIMWTVLSGDFDAGISVKRCLENVLLKARNGSIVVFHDSEKSAEKMRSVLPTVLKNFKERGFKFEGIPVSATV